MPTRINHARKETFRHRGRGPEGRRVRALPDMKPSGMVLFYGDWSLACILKPDRMSRGGVYGILA